MKLQIVVKGKEMLFKKNKVKFKYEIKKVIKKGNVYIVLLRKPIGIHDNENVFGVNEHGETIWQIEKTVHIYKDSPYMDLYEAKKHVWVGNWDGDAYRIDVKTGKILERKFTK
ncbi:MAG: hypothetical protein AB1439_06920 [candidate division FCPU426 bacterium]